MYKYPDKMLSTNLANLSFRAFPLASLLLDIDSPNFTILNANDALLEVTNTKSASLLIGKGIFETFPDNPNDITANGVSKLKASLCKVIETGTIQDMPPQKYDIAVPNSKRFEVKYWSVKNIPLFNDDGSIGSILHTTVDVTEKILLEQKEQEVEILIAQKKIILQYTETINEIGSWNLNLETGEFLWSPEFYKICGYTPNAFTPSLEKAIEIIHPDNLERVSAVYNNAIEKGYDYRIEHNIIRPDGQVILVLATGIVIKNADGKPIVLTGLFQNITNNKQIESMLVHTVSNLVDSEKKYKQLFENNPSPMFIWDFKTLQIIDCNEEALLLYGYTKEEFLTLNLKDIRPTEDVHLIAELNQNEADYSKLNKRIWRHKKKNGDIIHLYNVGYFFEQNDSKVVLVTLNDITEKKKIEEALKESELRYKSFFENGNNANFISTANGNVITANQMACNMLGYSITELCQMNSAQLCDLSDPRLITMNIDKDAKGTIAGIHTLLHKNGYAFDAYSHSNLYYDANGEERYAIVVKDLSEQQKAELALKESELRYRSFFENSLDAHFLTKENGKIIAANQVASKMFGYTVKELCELSRSQLADMTDPRLHKLIKDKKATGSASGIHKMFNKTGESFDVFTCSNIYFDIEGNERNAIIIKDLSELRKAENALIKSDEKYRLLFYKSPMPKWIYELETFKILEANDIAIEHYGYSRKEFLTLTILDLRSEEEIPNLFETNEANTSKDKIYTGGTFIHKKKNGELITVEILSLNIDYEGRDCKLVIAVDITDITNALKELALSNERYYYVTKATSDAIWDWDLVNNKVFWGDGFKDIFGYNIDKITSDTSFLLNNVHPDDRQKVMDEFYKIAKGDYTNWREEYRFKKVDDTYAYVVNKVFIIKNDKGKTIRIVGGLRDITKYKKELLRLQLLESVITNTSDMVIITEVEPKDDIEEQIIYVNEAFTTKTGYTQEEVFGKTARILQGPKTDRIELNRLKDCLKNLQPCNITVIKYTKNGEEYWSNMSISPVADITGWYTHWVAVERDVTERVQHESEIIKTIIKTQEEERYEIGSELHDNVCQILTTSKIAFKMLEKSLPGNKLSIFNDGIETLNSAFKEIRNLSHRLAPVFFDDTTLEQAFGNTLKAFNVDNHHQIILQFEEAFKEYPTTKEFQLNLFRILQEQLNNILKYAQATTITVQGFIKNDQLVLSIADDGIGFNSHLASTGIGLSNMKRRAELFNGKFILDTAPGMGCKLTIEVPLKDVD